MFPVFESPVARTSNQLLQGNLDEGYAGVLVRSVDLFDGPDLTKVWKGVAYRPLNTTVKYLPASYLHASLHAPNAIYYDAENLGFTILIGRKYKRNWAMKDFQTNNASVDCITYYPSDAGSVTRGVLEDPPVCIEQRTVPVCVNDTCLATNRSACGECQVPGNMTGWMLGEYKPNRTRGKLIYQTFMHVCWYQDLKELVAASNSMWAERKSWFRFGKSNDAAMRYQGWTECTATLNIRDRAMADAIVIAVGTPMRGGPSLCEHATVDSMQPRLQLAHDRGYAASLPVLLYRETKECDDVDCKWQKEFISQEYNFSNGACLRRHPACNEVYYLPDCRVEHHQPCDLIQLQNRTRDETGEYKISTKADVPFVAYQTWGAWSSLVAIAALLVTWRGLRKPK